MTTFSLTIAYVVWLDASSRAGTYNLDDALTSKLDGAFEQHSAGIFVGQTRQVVTIACDYDPDRQTYRDLVHIPRGMIRSLKLIRIKAKRVE